ncbi:hypothetical protein BA895_12165 [Humibacillus sp. DSM 29435]|uniref:TnsA-like heteromeric transposase endonuclease subunit n=1 Tax=Humibacillus sp. DSM 29435 TaxID=1869167 RepID=UPI000873241B|nr:TnsA-like heteromeric transposase endonuclease subunit [Humibacillus sp. DSM 29435]OFE18449.1 hypothetical protein BA895_12165 [Humibacillus sp. DSM 29435]
MVSVGLTAVGSQVGAATWTFSYAGDRYPAWAWSEGDPPVRHLEPMRRTKSGRLSKNIPVQAACMTTGGWLFLESGLEHELATWLDRKPEVVWLLGQPALLEWEDGLSHFPDLLSMDRDGEVTIWDARPPSRRDETYLVKSVRTQAACQGVGWKYEQFGGLSEVESLNLRWIAGARRPPEWLDPARNVLHDRLADGPLTIGEVMAADDGRGFLVSAMWHLVWSGQLSINLAVPWGRPTPIAWAHQGAGS